jgi:hypothetical protein
MSSILVAQTDVGGILKYFSEFHLFGVILASKRRGTKVRLISFFFRKYWVFILWGDAPCLILLLSRKEKNFPRRYSSFRPFQVA